MPRFLHSSQIPMALRRPHLQRYQKQLRDALLNPALTPEQRQDIRTKLAGLNSAPSNGNVVSPTVVQATLDDLLRLSKAEILTQATAEGVSVTSSWTKAKIAQALLSARAIK